MRQQLDERTIALGTVRVETIRPFRIGLGARQVVEVPLRGGLDVTARQDLAADDCVRVAKRALGEAHLSFGAAKSASVVIFAGAPPVVCGPGSMPGKYG